MNQILRLFGIFVIILQQLYSVWEWIVFDIVWHWAVIPTFAAFGWQKLVIAQVQLDTGIATGIKRWGYTKFESIHYATAKRFQPAQTLPVDFGRNLNVDVTSFPQSVRTLSMDRYPALKSFLINYSAKKTSGYLGSEEVGHQLNVWIPSSTFSSTSAATTTSSTSLRPVFVIFHGGAFVFSSCHQALIDGTSWARDRGYVVVTASYRLGIFGFLFHPEMDKSQITPNCGTLDQLLVLQWVQENISRFGGDPSNVTVGGQSAGAISVGSLLSIEGVANKLIHKAFMMSGANQNIQTTSQASRVYEDFAKRMNFTSKKNNYNNTKKSPGEESEEVASPSSVEVDHKCFASFLRSLPAGELVRIQKLVEADITHSYRNCTHNGLMPFHPTIDGVLFKKNPLQQMDDLHVAIPVFIGTTDVEYSFFTSLSTGGSSHPIDEKLLLSRLRQWTGECAPGDINDEIRQNVIDTYHNGTCVRRMGELKTKKWIAINGDFVFRVPVENFATQIVNNFRNPRSGVRQGHHTNHTNLNSNNNNNNSRSSGTITSSSCSVPCFVYCLSEPGFFTKLGAFHAIDLPFFFDRLLQSQVISGMWTPSRVSLKNRMMDDVDNFMKGKYDCLWQSWSEQERPVYFYNTRPHNDKVPPLPHPPTTTATNRCSSSFFYYSGLVLRPDEEEIKSWKKITAAIIKSSH